MMRFFKALRIAWWMFHENRKKRIGANVFTIWSAAWEVSGL